MKHYAPNSMLAPKEGSSQKHESQKEYNVTQLKS